MASILLLAYDDAGARVGSWNTSHPFAESVACGALVHPANTEDTNVTVSWYASSNVYGRIHIKSLGVGINHTLHVGCHQLSLTRAHKEVFSDQKRQLSSPTADVAMNVSWTFNSVSSVTDVCMTITNLRSAQWAAVGLGLDQSMVRISFPDDGRGLKESLHCRAERMYSCVNGSPMTRSSSVVTSILTGMPTLNRLS